MGSRPRTEAGGRADSVQRSAYRCRSLVAILLDPHTPLLPSHAPLPPQGDGGGAAASPQVGRRAAPHRQLLLVCGSDEGVGQSLEQLWRDCNNYGRIQTPELPSVIMGLEVWSCSNVCKKTKEVLKLPASKIKHYLAWRPLAISSSSHRPGGEAAIPRSWRPLPSAWAAAASTGSSSSDGTPGGRQSGSAARGRPRAAGEGCPQDSGPQSAAEQEVSFNFQQTQMHGSE